MKRIATVGDSSADRRRPPSKSPQPAAETYDVERVDEGLPRFVTRLLDGGECAAEFLLLFLVLLVAAEVLCRSALGFSLQVVDELSGQLLVGIVFLALGQSIKHGNLLRVDFIINLFPEKARIALDRLYALIGIGVLVIYLWEIWRFVAVSWRRGTVATLEFPIPQWIPQSVMIVGTVLAMIAFAYLLAKPTASGGDGGNL